MKDLTLPSSQSSDTSKASSSSSYASAVSSVQDLSINLDEVDYPSFLVKPFCQPALLAAYASYLQPLTCINWRQKIPSDLQKNFSLLNNLKVSIIRVDERCSCCYVKYKIICYYNLILFCVF